MVNFDFLREKSDWVWKETLKIHKIAPGIRLASALSCVEILTVLYYGEILEFDPKDIHSENRDRFIISKAHGSVSFYPILADLGYFDSKYLRMVGKPGSILGDIPDCSIPGYETANGSLGYGLGVACGMSLALKKKGKKEKVVVLSGDGELYEGSVWEAVMFAAHHNLDNLILIIDNNKICMLDYCAKILNLEPLDKKFEIFNWKTKIVDGHNIKELYDSLLSFKKDEINKPKVLIANTIKGKSVPRLETDSLCHIKALKAEEIDKLLREK
ncbi:MAG: thiamine pyrophosphate-dependent enzyme [bacterium]